MDKGHVMRILFVAAGVCGSSRKDFLEGGWGDISKFLSASTDLVASMLPACYQHVANMLPAWCQTFCHLLLPCCQHFTSILSACCQHVVSLCRAMQSSSFVWQQGLKSFQSCFILSYTHSQTNYF